LRTPAPLPPTPIAQECRICCPPAKAPALQYKYCDLLQILSELVHPAFQILKRLAAGQIKDDQPPKRVFIESLVERSVSFLASRVPNLQHHNFVIDGDMLFRKLQANGGISSQRESVLDVPGDDVRLAHSTLPSVIEQVPTRTILIDFF